MVDREYYICNPVPNNERVAAKQPRTTPDSLRPLVGSIMQEMADHTTNLFVQVDGLSYNEAYTIAQAELQGFAMLPIDEQIQRANDYAVAYSDIQYRTTPGEKELAGPAGITVDRPQNEPATGQEARKTHWQEAYALYEAVRDSKRREDLVALWKPIYISARMQIGGNPVEVEKCVERAFGENASRKSIVTGILATQLLLEQYRPQIVESCQLAELDDTE